MRDGASLAKAGTWESPSVCALETARVVFVTRYFPYPARAGAWIYTVQMINLWAQLAQRVDVFCGAGPQREVSLAGNVDHTNVYFTFGTSRKSSALGYLSSRGPKAAAEFTSGENRERLASLLQVAKPSIVVIDHLGSSWALPVIERYRRSQSAPVRLVYTTHNEETSTRLSIAREAGILKGAVHAYDALLINIRDRRLLEAADLLTYNTEDDRRQYEKMRVKDGEVFPPLFTREVVEQRVIDSGVPRKIVIVGSFLWSAKMINLWRFLKVACRNILRSGVTLEVIGRMREVDLVRLRTAFSGVVFHGEVPSVEPYLSDARIGLLIDQAGGGFKHTALTYAFNRVPVASLESAIKGSGWAGSVIAGNTYADLVEKVLIAIDDIDHLNKLQSGLFTEASPFLDEAKNLSQLRSALIRMTKVPAP